MFHTKNIFKRMMHFSLLTSVGFAALLLVCAPALAQGLGDAYSFAILGGSAVNANGTGSVINGDVGVSPGSSITGFPASATVTLPFSTHITDGPANNARASTLTLYNSLAAMGGATPILPGLNGQILGPGIYTTGAALLVTGGTLTLSGAGTYIFQVTSSLTTGVGSNVVLNGVDPCNVFWQVTSLATLDGATFPGTVVAQAGVHLGTGASLTGRALAAAAGDVTMAGSNTVGGCSQAPPLLGSITINKTAVGGDATFGYTGSAALGAPFNITTSGGTGSHGTTTGLSAGAYTVTESTMPAGWVWTGLACTDSTAGSTFGYVGAQANIALAPGGTVTCTYTNVKQGSITINKTAVGGDATFGYTASAALGTSFNITTSGGTGSHGTTTGLSVGLYTVTESTVPAGWVRTGLVCTDSTGGSTFSYSGARADIALAAGGTVTCTFTNNLLPPATAVPTLNEWGVIIFMVLVGLMSIYYLRRQKAKA